MIVKSDEGQAHIPTLIAQNRTGILNDKIIYDCYKPQTLKDARDFGDFILKYRKIHPNKVVEFDPDNSTVDSSSERLEPDFDFETEMGLITNKSLANYFKEYAARTKSNV